MTTKNTYTPTYWNGEGELQEIHDALSDALVPDYGDAPTEHGNALRWINNIYYEIYNNGGCNARDNGWRSVDGLDAEYAKGIDLIVRVAELSDSERGTLRNGLKNADGLCDGIRPVSAERLDAIVTKVTRAALMAHLKSIPKPESKN